MRRRPGPPGEHEVGHHRHPGARLDHPQHGVHLPTLHGEPRADPGVGERAQGGLPQVVALPGHDERPAGQLPQPHRAARRRRLPGRRGRHRQPLPQQRHGVQRRVAPDAGTITSAMSSSPRTSDRTSGCDPLSASSSAMAGYCSWNTRSTSASTPLHSDGVAPTRTRPRASPTISATATRAPSASASIRRANGSTAWPAAVSVGPSRAPRSTERRSQLVLERLELPRQRRLRHPDELRGPSETAHVCHGQEVPELLQRHRHSLRASDRAISLNDPERPVSVPRVVASAPSIPTACVGCTARTRGC